MSDAATSLGVYTVLSAPQVVPNNTEESEYDSCYHW